MGLIRRVQELVRSWMFLTPCRVKIQKPSDLRQVSVKKRGLISDKR